jgi:hypothetical protein
MAVGRFFWTGGCSAKPGGKVIKKNTCVFGKMVYIWQDFEKGLNKKKGLAKTKPIRENGENKNNQAYNRKSQKRCAIIMHSNNW